MGVKKDRQQNARAKPEAYSLPDGFDDDHPVLDAGAVPRDSAAFIGDAGFPHALDAISDAIKTNIDGWEARLDAIEYEMSRLGSRRDVEIAAE